MRTRWTTAPALLTALALAGCLVRNPNIEHEMRPTEAGRGTAPQLPNFEASDEATPEQLERARDQGNAERQELEWVRAHDAVASGEMAAGEYRVAYVVSPPMGWHDPGAGGAWYDAPNDPGAAHLGIVVRDAADGREVPGLGVRVTVRDASGRTVTQDSLAYGWYPVLNRYGANVLLPTGGFTLRVELAPPTYWRHDPTNGDRFADSATAEFADVRVDAAALQRARAGAATASLDSARQSLARLEGEALARPLTEMFSNVAVNGAETRVGDYLVVIALERAEGYWMAHGEKLWYNVRVAQSAETNAHVEVGVRDARTGRFLPGLAVHATVLDGTGQVVGTHDQPFMWHPWIHHYGQNWRVPGSGRYTIRMHADAPPYRQWAFAPGTTAFAGAVDAEIAHLKIRTGQK